MIGVDGLVFLVLASVAAVLAPVGSDRLARLKPLWAAGILLSMVAAGMSMVVRAAVQMRPLIVWLLMAVEFAAFAVTNRYWLHYLREKKS